MKSTGSFDRGFTDQPRTGPVVIQFATRERRTLDASQRRPRVSPKMRTFMRNIALLERLRPVAFDFLAETAAKCVSEKDLADKPRGGVR